MNATADRLNKWRKRLQKKLEKVEAKDYNDYNSSIVQREHRMIQIDTLRQKIEDLGTAIEALE